MMDGKNDSMTRISQVRVSGKEDPVVVPITSRDKPEIPAGLVEKWQNIADIIARLCNVPASLIMRIQENQIEVFISSASGGNPYEKGEKADLGSGLYCETVMGSRSPLLVPNALADPLWEKNPDVKLKMISYYGLPIQWQDGELFGTLCILDRSENAYDALYFDLMRLMKENIEQDLQLLQEREYYRRQNSEKDLRLREINHRIKNNYNMVLGFLHFQKKDPAIRTTIQDLESRIKTISMIHEKLSLSADLHMVGMREYIDDLIQAILAMSGREYVKLTLDAPALRAGDREMLTLGLIINELVTNSLKYSLEGNVEPQIRVGISQPEGGVVTPEGGVVTMEYSDNGAGLPDGFSIDSTSSLGMTLVRMMAANLKGDVAIRTGRPTVFTFRLDIGGAAPEAGK
jgi:c-di-GMP phosphodiesterase